MLVYIKQVLTLFRKKMEFSLVLAHGQCAEFCVTQHKVSLKLDRQVPVKVY